MLDYKYTNAWLRERQITLKAGFADLLKNYAKTYKKTQYPII